MYAIAHIPVDRTLLDFFHARHDQLAVGDDQSLRNGTTGYFPLETKEPKTRLLFDYLKGAIDFLLKTDFKNWREWKFSGVWSNRLVTGGYHVEHTHPEGWMSGVYYMDVPNKGSGHLVIGETKIQALPGAVVMFPSVTPHSVTEYQGKTPRLAVAFDVVPV